MTKADKNYRAITEAIIAVIHNPDCPKSLRDVIADALLGLANEQGGFYFNADVLRVWLPQALRKSQASE